MENASLEDFRDHVCTRQADIKSLADLIISDERVMAAALDNLTQKNETIRYNSYRAIKTLTEKQPGLFYPHWDFFISQLHSENTYHILVGIHILADLTRVDKEGRFEKIFDRYYQLLNHRSMVVISHVCLASGRIMQHKPGLISKIEDILLKIEQYIAGQKHKDLIKAAVLEAFTEARSLTIRKKEIREFATSLLDSAESPKGRKLALSYLESQDE